MKRKIFVAYIIVSADDTVLLGNAEVSTEGPIKSIRDIHKLEATIRIGEKSAKNVRIISWREFEAEAVPDGTN